VLRGTMALRCPGGVSGPFVRQGYRMADFPINVCRVDTPEGTKDYVTCLSHEHVFAYGLPAQAIIGVLLRPLEPGEAITPSAFARNRVFVDFMHQVIARRGPELPGLIAEARRQDDGWVYVIDQRTRTPQGAVPPEDIVGAFEVKDGRIVPGSYRPSPKHMLLSSDGFFRLGSELQPSLLEELVLLAKPVNGLPCQ
jgi:hypothetical protein